MSLFPFQERHYHPIRWMEKMAGYVNDSYRNRNPKLGLLFDEFEAFDNSPTDFYKPLEQVLKESDFPFISTEGWYEYIDEIFDFIFNFYEHGQNIFHINKDLANMLINTDVGQVRINDIKLPYEGFYLHFGDTKIPLWNNFFFEGVYVDNFTTEPDKEIVLGFLYIVSKRPSLYPENSSSQIIFSYESHLFDIMTYYETETETVDENTRENFDGDRTMSGLEYEIHQKWKPHIEKINSLVINSLLFISSYPEDVENGFSKSTPKSLTRKFEKAIQRGDEKTRDRTESKIKSAGYRKVKIVGNRLSNSSNKTGLKVNSPSAHWRRGHWRRQPIGKQLKKTKLIWIEPTLVATDNSSNIKINHLYKVDQSKEHD